LDLEGVQDRYGIGQTKAIELCAMDAFVSYFIATEAHGRDDVEIRFRPRLAPDAREVAVVFEAASGSLTVLVDLGEAR